MRIKIVWRTIDGEPEAEVRIWRGDVFLMPALFVLYAAGFCPFLFYPLKWIPGIEPILIAVTLLGLLGSWEALVFRGETLVHRPYRFGVPFARRILNPTRINGWVEPFTNEAVVEIGDTEIPIWSEGAALELSAALQRITKAIAVEPRGVPMNGRGRCPS